jgi:hypothetical protein
VIPKFDGQKVIIDNKPCGYNEVISKFIAHRTGVVRTRKEVASHIEVLKKWRKTDLEREFLQSVHNYSYSCSLTRYSYNSGQ